MSLLSEREEWQEQYRRGGIGEPWLLQKYKKERATEEWRSTRLVEHLCEYAIYLENELKEIKNDD